MTTISLKCRQEYSEEDHECLEEMTLEELYEHLKRGISEEIKQRTEKDDAKR